MTITLDVIFCFFHNVGHEETAEALGVAPRFVRRVYLLTKLFVYTHSLIEALINYHHIQHHVFFFFVNGALS